MLQESIARQTRRPIFSLEAILPGAAWSCAVARYLHPPRSPSQLATGHPELDSDLGMTAVPASFTSEGRIGHKEDKECF